MIIIIIGIFFNWLQVYDIVHATNFLPDKTETNVLRKSAYEHRIVCEIVMNGIVKNKGRFTSNAGSAAPKRRSFILNK